MKKLLIIILLLFNLVPYYYDKGSLITPGMVFAGEPDPSEEKMITCQCKSSGVDKHPSGQCPCKKQCDDPNATICCCGNDQCEKNGQPCYNCICGDKHCSVDNHNQCPNCSSPHCFGCDPPPNEDDDTGDNGGEGGTYCNCCHSSSCSTPNSCSACDDTGGDTGGDTGSPCPCCGSYECSTPGACPACYDTGGDSGDSSGDPCVCCGSTSCTNKGHCGKGACAIPCCCGLVNCPKKGQPCVTCLCGDKHCPTPNTEQCECCDKPHCTGCCGACTVSQSSLLKSAFITLSKKKCVMCCQGHPNCTVDHCAAAPKCTISGCGKILTAMPGCNCGEVCAGHIDPCIASCDNATKCTFPGCGKVKMAVSGCSCEVCPGGHKCCKGEADCTKDHCAEASKCSLVGCGKILTAIAGCNCGNICPTHPCPPSKDSLKKVFPDADTAMLEKLANLLEKYGFDYGINSKEKLQHFIAQAGHETGGFKNLGSVESLYYKDTARLIIVFPSYFSHTDTITKRKPDDYTKNQQKVANYVYSSRMGNDKEASGEGYKYRGRGIFQLTGKDNYTNFKNYYNNKYDPDIDLNVNPDLISSNDTIAVLSALWFYKTEVLDKITVNDKTTVKAVTKKINPPLLGIDDRKSKFDSAKTYIDCKK